MTEWKFGHDLLLVFIFREQVSDTPCRRSNDEKLELENQNLSIIAGPCSDATNYHYSHWTVTVNKLNCPATRYVFLLRFDYGERRTLVAHLLTLDSVLTRFFFRFGCGSSITLTPEYFQEVSERSRSPSGTKKKPRLCDVYQHKWKRRRCVLCMKCYRKGCLGSDLTGIEEMCDALGCPSVSKACRSKRVPIPTLAPTTTPITQGHLCQSCTDMGCFSENGARQKRCRNSICSYLADSCSGQSTPASPPKKKCRKCLRRK